MIGKSKKIFRVQRAFFLATLGNFMPGSWRKGKNDFSIVKHVQ